MSKTSMIRASLLFLSVSLAGFGVINAQQAPEARQEYFVPAMETVEPIGSNPKANKMSAETFAKQTAAWREEYEQYRQKGFDYTDNAWAMEPPVEGRLKQPLPIMRNGKMVAEIIVNLDPALHTPEATLGRDDYPAEVGPMRYTGHLIVKNAVEELKLWIDTITDSDIPVRERPGTGLTRIYVGANYAKTLFAKDLKELGEGEALDGYAVRSRGRNVYIFGATTKGVLNGVYAFLENNTDLIWAHGVSDIGTVYTKNPKLAVVWADGLEKPGTIQRGWGGHYREKNGKPNQSWMWMMRNRANFIVAPGPAPKIAEWGNWREAGGHMLGTFAPKSGESGKDFFPSIPNPKTGELEKPEKILHYHHNICLTHPELYQQYADKMVSYIKAQQAKHPDRPIDAVRLGVEDPGANRNYGLCQCETCMRPIKLPDGQVIPYQGAIKEGLDFRTTQFHLLLEYISRAMQKETPGVRLTTYAYYFAAKPPSFQTSVQPWLCPYGGVPSGQLYTRDMTKPIFWQSNQLWWDYAYDWSRITDMTVWRDYHNIASNGRPFAQIVAWDINALKTLGISRFLNESSLNVAFDQMDYWVSGRLYWNPKASVDKLTEYYLRRTYHEGAPAMGRFFAKIHKYWYVQFSSRADFIQLGWMIDRTGLRESLYEDLLEAEKLAQNPLAKANINRLRLTFEQWYDLNLPEHTSREMLQNAKLGTYVPYSSFASNGQPAAVSQVTFKKKGAALQSKPLFIEDDRKAMDFQGWTLKLRIKSADTNAAKAAALPQLQAGSSTAGDKPAVAWSQPITAEVDSDGSAVYEFKLADAGASDKSLFDAKNFSHIKLLYPSGQQANGKDQALSFVLYEMRLTDPKGQPFVMSTLAERMGKRDRAKWR